MFWPDVLDAMGKTPREFGGLHVHLESAQRVGGGRVVASLLIQGAFRPIPQGALVIFFTKTRELARPSLPSPSGAEVIRVRYPLEVDAGITELGALILAPPIEESAERVRPAWKLHDTFEIPRLSEMEPYREASLSFDPTGTVLSSILSGGLSPEFNVRTVELAPNATTKVHQARELPPHLTCAIEGETTLDDGVSVETIWRDGDALPSGPAITPGPAPKRSAIKRCAACAFEGPAQELERLTTCPACDALWS